MNCPNCPSPLICPEGGIAYCSECGWGMPLWVEKQERIRALEKRNGELIDAILTHRRDTAPGATAVDRKLWATVIDPIPYGI